MAYQVQRLEEFLAQPEPYRCATCPYCNGERDPTPKFPKPDPWTWWESLGKPKSVVAPMVDQSELPFRMLCRKYGATLAYTPMFHSGNFAQSAEYRRREFSTCPEDRPLFAQFCGHDADTVLAATRHIDDLNLIDAIDLNLGCPQGIAKKGFYGAFLMERWDVIHTILHTLVVELRVPVTAKMRLFDDEALTLRYARMLRDTGIQLLAVHGRTREMKGQQTGIADMDMVRRVKAHITTIPVLANGNVLSYPDVASNLELTGCEGILSAEGLLWDPRLFANPQRPVLTGRGHCADRLTRIDAIATAKEYLEFVRKFPVDGSFAKAHIFKIVHHSLEVHPTFRVALGDSGTMPRSDMIAEMMAVVEGLAQAEANCDVDIYQKQPKRDGQAVLECAVGCRPQAAPADYESAVDESFANLFDLS